MLGANLETSLNHKELQAWSVQCGAELKGRFIEKIWVPKRSYFREGFQKNEWVLELSEQVFLLIGLQSTRPFVACLRSELKASRQAPKSGFQLSLSKYLLGRKIKSVEAFPNERILCLWFQASARTNTKLGLILLLIPNRTQGFIVEENLKILAQSRKQAANKKAEEKKNEEFFQAPTGGRAPAGSQVRFYFGLDRALTPELPHWEASLEESIQKSAFESRKKTALARLDQQQKENKKELKKFQKTKDESSPQSFRQQAELLQANLGQLKAQEENNPSTPKPLVWQVREWASGKVLEIPRDARRSPSEQMQFLYQQASRQERRLLDLEERIKNLLSEISETERLLSQTRDLPPGLKWPEWEQLRKLEVQVGLSESENTIEAGIEKKRSPGSKTRVWLGKVFYTKEGVQVWAGRNQKENMELCFKVARGNDLWMHLRGRPGAHIILPLSQTGQSASLDSLLDAAQITIALSGGRKWGKTEVDYTFRKYLKRIPGSSEVSYSQNKTLLVEPDPLRLERLLAGKKSKKTTP